MRKILIVSHSPVAPTGYGRVVRWLTSALQRRALKVVCLGDGHTGAKSGMPYTVEPWENLSKDAINNALKRFRPQVLLTLGDPWMFEELHSLPERRKVKWVAYFPLDGTPLPEKWKVWMHKPDVPVVLSQFAQQLVRTETTVFPPVTYHGVDVNIFSPKDKQVAKGLIRASGRFVVGTVARNQQRKNIPALVKAFSIFAAGKDNVMLYLHTQMQGTYDIGELVRRFGVEHKTRVTADLTHNWGLSDEDLAAVYNAMDVFVLPTMAEGFGLPIIEAQACGVPALVTDYSACPELVPDPWQRLKVKEMLVMGNNFDQAIVDTDDIVAKLETLYRDRERLAALGKEAHRFAQRFEWETVMSPLLDLLTAAATPPAIDAVEPVPATKQSGPINEENARWHFEKAAATVSPYPGGFRGRGIVIVGGGLRYFPCAWVCFRMLRTWGCTLPIELWYLGPDEMSDGMKGLVSPFGVECVDGHAMATQNGFGKPDGWELKSLAILCSRFEQVLMLDADNFPITDPTYLFESEQFRKAGAVFWPDYGEIGKDDPIWELTGVHFRSEPSFESGQILVDKKRCWQPLQLAAWLNRHSAFWYRYMFGDKDTFHLAWRKLDRPYAMPPHRIADMEYAMGQHDFEGRRIFQHRNRAKWRLTGWNPKMPDFQHEEKGFALLAELKERWSPQEAEPDLSATKRVQAAWQKYKNNQSEPSTGLLSAPITAIEDWELIGMVAEHVERCIDDASTVYLLRRAAAAMPNVVELKQMLKKTLRSLGHVTDSDSIC